MISERVVKRKERLEVLKQFDGVNKKEDMENEERVSIRMERDLL